MQTVAEAQVAGAHEDREQLKARVKALVESGTVSAAQAEVSAEDAALAQEELTRLHQKVRHSKLRRARASRLQPRAPTGCNHMCRCGVSSSRWSRRRGWRRCCSSGRGRRTSGARRYLAVRRS